MKKTLIALVLASASSFAVADSWIYGGVNVGQSSLEGDSASTVSVHAGTGILPFIGLEAGYVSHGTSEFSADLSDYKYDSSSYYLAAKPSIDFGPLHIYGKAGLHSYSLKGQEGTKSDDGVDVMYGVGVEYFLFDMFSVGAGYQNFMVGSDRNIDSFTLNASVHIL